MSLLDTIFSLHIETSTSLCSVSIGMNNLCIDTIETEDRQSHSERLHTFIQQIMNKHALSFSRLHVVAVSAGPGSYTGLRIGAATAKTIAYAMHIPLVDISSLHTLAWAYIFNHAPSPSVYIAAVMPARGKKIYLGVYDYQGKEQIAPCSFLVHEENLIQLKNQFKHKELIFVGKDTIVDALLVPYVCVCLSSKFMTEEVYRRYQRRQFASSVYFEPLYL